MKNNRSGKRMINTSKFISLILRHRPGIIGMSTILKGTLWIGRHLKRSSAQTRSRGIPLTKTIR